MTATVSPEVLECILLAELRRHGPARAFEIAARTALSRDDVRAGLCRLEDQGLIGHGYWVLNATATVPPDAHTITSEPAQIGSAS